MSVQAKITSETDFLMRLQSLSNGNTGVTINYFEPLLKEMPERISVDGLRQLINFASDQTGIWEAEWMFSPANSPNTTAKEESERWSKLWGTCVSMLLERVPNVREQIEKMHSLIVLKHTIAKGLDYNRNKPILRLAATVVSKIAIRLNSLGFKGIAEYLYALSLYPKGTVGRTTG